MVSPAASRRRNSSQLAHCGHEVGVGDEHPRRPFVGAEHADRLARLDQQGLVVLQVPQRVHDGVEGVPAARRPARAAVDDELVGVLGDLGVEVVHQHPHGRLLRPALAAQGRPARGTDRPGPGRAVAPGARIGHWPAPSRTGSVEDRDMLIIHCVNQGALARLAARPRAAIAGQLTVHRETAASSMSAPRPGRAGTFRQPSASMRTGSARKKSRRCSVQPGGS